MSTGFALGYCSNILTAFLPDCYGNLGMALKRHLTHIFIILVLTLPYGCGTFKPLSPGELAMQDGEFLGLWDSYNYCMAGQNVQDLEANLSVLHSAPKPISLDESPIPIPQFLKELSSTRGSRLAVDPRAMAASCSLHLAEVAIQVRDWETAFRTLRDLPVNYPEPQYAYYVSRATASLEQLSSLTRPVSLSFRESLVQ